MSQQKLLKKVIGILEYSGIKYMLTGSVAASMQGEPRATHDIDIVINISISQTEKLLNFFPEKKYYLDKESVMAAIKNQKMFNLIDLQSGDKIDFWILTESPFDKKRFSRRVQEEVFGIKVMVSSPEDTILAKLRWAELSGGSEKQFIDALRIFEVQYGRLDMDYLARWIKKLGVEKLWERLKEEAVVEL